MKASAGSGKTYSLARTYISLLLRNDDRYAYRHILAVTFTNKATDEMKSRILKELHQMAVAPEMSSYLNDFVPSLFLSADLMQKKAQAVLHDILHDYSAFAVSTIDRFFQQTLKAFSREIGQFASYQLELDRKSLVAESVDRILDSLTEDSGSLLSWLTDNVLEQIEQGGRYSLDANLMNMAMRLKSPQRQELLECNGIDEEESYSKDNLLKIRTSCRDIMTSFRDEVRAKACSVLAVLKAAGVDPSDSNRGFLKVLYTYEESDGTDVMEAPTEAFFRKAEDCDSWFAKSKAPRFLPLVYPVLQGPLEDFCSLWGKEYSVYRTAHILDSQIYGLGVAAELRNTYVELMKEKNVLSIEDSNIILRDIIDGSDAPFVYEKLGVRFEHFLLDEFQDTAQVQWTNFSPLLHNSDAQGGENLIVGDVKQSIYRWRGSDWKLLDHDIPEEFPDYVEEVLDTNYRSLCNIVGFNNGFFPMAAHLLDSESERSEDESVKRIYSDVVQNVAKMGADGGNVELVFCDKEKELSEVLNAVRKAVGCGAMYSDIAVLVRSNAIGEDVASFLIDNNVPVITDDSLKVKSSITVRRIVSLMSSVENPDNMVNGYLADSLDIDVDGNSGTLIDLAESLVRSLKRNGTDGFRDGEALYVQSFMDCLQDYSSLYGNGLRGFLRYWSEVDPSIASPSSGDCVRIMTIHKSKGLDFPYVIIPFVESITLYKPDNSWCSPDLAGTELEGVAEGVYDVKLSESTESTLFAGHYKRERFLQQVDNLNTLYVAMTRASLGMCLIARTPSEKMLVSIKDGAPVSFSDFSQMLYSYSVEKGLEVCKDDDIMRFSCGSMVDFSKFHNKIQDDVSVFPMRAGEVFPSIALNSCEGSGDVGERGRLKFSADSLEFFSDENVSESSRVKGIVLHEVMSSVISPDDIESAVDGAFRKGELTWQEAEEAKAMLEKRIAQVKDRGWFPQEYGIVLNERDIIDIDGSIYRPDRVLNFGDKVVIVDYKFGDHHRKYERQLKTYADIWHRMGASNVTAFLWYVHTGEVLQVV